MKQIFDWLREQMDENTFNGISENGVFFVPIIHSKIAKLIINEAEAKWEAECCEWVRADYIGGVRYVKAHDTWEKQIDVEDWTYCPYCGKPIKISEVG